MACASCDGVGAMAGAHTERVNPCPACNGVSAYADEHESGQLRLACAGEQVSLLPLPDETIPTMQDEEA